MKLLLPMLLVVAVILGAAAFLIGILLLRPWLMCFMSGASVPAFKIVAMRLRGAPVQLIIEQRIRANYVGVDLSTEELERAHQQGADIVKLVDALCVARQSERDISWEDLLATELSGR